MEVVAFDDIGQPSGIEGILERALLLVIDAHTPYISRRT